MFFFFNWKKPISEFIIKNIGINQWSVHENAIKKCNSPSIQVKTKLKIIKKIFTVIKNYTLHLCCALSDSIKSCKFKNSQRFVSPWGSTQPVYIILLEEGPRSSCRMLGSLSCTNLWSSSVWLMNGRRVVSRIRQYSSASIIPSNMHTLVAPFRLIPAHTCTLSECLGFGFLFNGSSTFR